MLAASAGHDAAAEIAAELHLSEGTVRNYLSAAIRKLGARNRREAVELAVKEGLVVRRGTIASAMAEERELSLQEQLEGIGAQLDWVRGYL